MDKTLLSFCVISNIMRPILKLAENINIVEKLSFDIAPVKIVTAGFN